MEIISERQTVTVVEFTRQFDWADAEPGCGFAFPCDEDGNVDVAEMAEAAQKNFHKCITGQIDVIDRGIERREYSYTEPRVGRCDCGCEVTLDRFTNTCWECGADYNMSGSRLADRSQWGQETGEHWTDCY
jgi:hypothetical protein